MITVEKPCLRKDTKDRARFLVKLQLSEVIPVSHA